jgi:hypothetical protein
MENAHRLMLKRSISFPAENDTSPTGINKVGSLPALSSNASTVQQKKEQVFNVKREDKYHDDDVVVVDEEDEDDDDCLVEISSMRSVCERDQIYSTTNGRIPSPPRIDRKHSKHSMDFIFGGKLVI